MSKNFHTYGKVGVVNNTFLDHHLDWKLLSISCVDALFCIYGYLGCNIKNGLDMGIVVHA